MPLITDWKKVATAGPTVDGREIPEQALRDIAELYSTDKYQALIWPDHRRWFGNWGLVSDVKTEKNADDELCLFAKIQPNEFLLDANKVGQKLFTSIELLPNYRGTGKTYLRGLAVTDEPASIGTDLLEFSRLNPGQDAPLISLPMAFSLDLPSEAERSLFTRFKQFLSQADPEYISAVQPSAPDTQDPPMDTKQFAQMSGLLTQQTEAITSLGNSLSQFTAQFSKQPAAPETETEQPAAEPVTTTTESTVSDGQFSQQLLVLMSKQGETLEKLSGQFASLATEQAGTQVDPATGTDTSQKGTY